MATPAQNAILGKGIWFPFSFTGTNLSSDRGVKFAEGEDSVKQSLHVIIATHFASRIMRRDFGCQLGEHVFDPIQPDFDHVLEYVIKESIAKWERRIVLGPLSFDRSKAAEGKILINLEYRVIRTQVVGNLVYPWYVTVQNAA